mmetsp:Transcript_39097/g.110741  ORF Transcript_39097/g.110741 Transcript_39097/m.110741 type:complete len:655 (+) Transcript_39097:203-2167(+)
MQSQELNLHFLDELVLEYLRVEELVEEDSDDSASADTRLRRACAKCCECMTSGRIAEGIELAKGVCPGVFEDQRLLFQVKKQQYIECLRSGDNRGAVEVLRRELAPLALGAYPEAYEEFKRSMLLLVYTPGSAGTPVSSEGSEEQRTHTAKLLDRTLKHAAGITEPRLVLVANYLLQCCVAVAKVHDDAPVPEMAAITGVCMEGRDPAPLALDHCGHHIFPEADIQALIHAVDIQRHSAVQALSHAHGDVDSALKNELSRLRTQKSAVDQLVLQYACYRGIVSIEKSASAAAAEEGEAAMETDGGLGEGGAEAMETSGDQSGAPEETPSLDFVGQAVERPLQWVGRRCGTAAATKEGAKSSLPVNAHSGNGIIVPEGPEGQRPEENGENLAESCRQYAATIRLRGLAREGLVQEVVDGVQSLDPGFFDANPQLLFELKRCEFLRCVEAGDARGALTLARQDLGPLAERCPRLLSTLKQTLLVLLERDPDTQTPTSVVATALQSALRESLGLAEPTLLQVFRCMLNMHSQWFRLQRCKDRFAGMLGIDRLKDQSHLPPALCTAAEGQPAAATAATVPGRGGGETPTAAAPGAGGRSFSGAFTRSPSASPSGGEGVPSEASILTLMEFMALSRPTAIEYLLQNDGDVEAAIASLIG